MTGYVQRTNQIIKGTLLDKVSRAPPCLVHLIPSSLCYTFLR